MFWWGLLIGFWIAAPLGFVLAGLMRHNGPDCLECTLWREKWIGQKSSDNTPTK